MHNWRHPSLLVMALVALLASLLPSQGWSCPMSGRVGSAAFVCAQMAQKCAVPGSKCCQPVTLATESFSLDGEAVAVLTPAPQLVPTPLIWWAGSPEAVLSRNFLPFFSRLLSVQSQDILPLHFSSRHGPPPFSGRAPPLA